MVLKSYSNVGTFFQQTNGLCTCIIKIVIIFLNKEAILLKKELLSIFCAVMTIEVLF